MNMADKYTKWKQLETLLKNRTMVRQYINITLRISKPLNRKWVTQSKIYFMV